MLPLLSLCVCNPTCSLRGAARSAVDCRVGSRSSLVGCHSPGRRSHLSRVRGRCGGRERTHRGVLDVLFPRLRPRRGGCRQQRSLHRHRAAAADSVRRRTAGPEPDRGREQHSTAGSRHQRRVPAGEPVPDHAGRHSRRPGDRRAAALPAAAASNRARPYVGTAPHASFGTRGHAHTSNFSGCRRVGHEAAAEAFRPGAPSLLGAAGRQPASASVGVFGTPHSPTAGIRQDLAGTPLYPGTAQRTAVPVHRSPAIGTDTAIDSAAADGPLPFHRRACSPDPSGALPGPLRTTVRDRAAPLTPGGRHGVSAGRREAPGGARRRGSRWQS